MPESVDIDWKTFTEKLQSPRCKVENGKLICEGTLDNKPAVCEVTQRDGEAKVTCLKYLGEESPV